MVQEYHIKAEAGRCLSEVCIDPDGGRQAVMKDVAMMKACRDGYIVIDLLGSQMFVQGRIKSVDLTDTHAVLIDPERK